MVGYLNHEVRVLEEWYKLFIQKRQILSNQDYEYWENLKKMGFPNNQHDDWKHTSLKEFLEHNFVNTKPQEINYSQYEALALPIDSYRLTFINGQLSTKFSDKNISPWKIVINKSLNRYKISNIIQPNIFINLTECLSDAIININLSQGNITKKPLYLLYINDGLNKKKQLSTSYYHNILNVEDNTDTCIIEHFVNINNYGHFNNTFMSIKTGKKTKLNHIKLVFENRSSYHISYQDIRIGDYSHVDSNIFIIFGPKFTRHQTNVIINHPQASLSLNSLTLLAEKDIGNICTYLEHNNKNYAFSKQLHKIIACDSSTGVFSGLIKVNKNSSQTDGKMINKNLLFHKSAKIYTTPKLEIYSDNVQCSHGATIGHIDKNHLFYLITRGINKQDALKMLIHAFSVEVIDKIKNNLLKKIILTRISYACNRSINEHLSYRKN